MISLAACLCAAVPAVSHAASNAVKSTAFVEAIATRGHACGLLAPWQASAIRALAVRDMERWDVGQRASLPTEIESALSKMTCESDVLAAWIEGASRGFDSEMLAPYLVVYRVLASYETPPKIFTYAAPRLQYASAVTAINVKLAELEASGAVPEGGGTWSAYIDRTETAARDFVSYLSNEDAAPEDRDMAAAWLAQSAHIIELWLHDHQE